MAIATKKPGGLKKSGATIRKRKSQGGKLKYAAFILPIIVILAVIAWLPTRPSLKKAEQLLATDRSSEAIAMFTGLADGGNLEAVKKLGLLYYTGDEVDRNPEKAIPYLRKAADAGDSDAQAILGNIHYFGTGGKQDYDLAMQYLLPLEGSNDARALSVLGRAYYDGKGVAQDRDKAFQLLSKAASFGNEDANDILGLLYYHGQGVKPDVSKGLSLMASIPAGVNQEADRILGTAYYLGRDIEENRIKAAPRLLKCSVDDDVEACYCLGMLYSEGQGMPQDSAQAEKYLSLAAEKGLTAAYLPLGILSYSGGGASPNYPKAHKYLELAAKDGEGRAYSMLGRMYYDGNGVEEDHAKAAEYFVKALGKDHNPENNQLLGKMYYEGDGVKQDYGQAAGYLAYAADRGDVDAQVLMAKLYYYGRGVERDYSKTLQLLKRGIADGVPAALSLRGRMYYYGDGGEWDEDAARNLLSQAAAHDDQDAKKLLYEMRPDSSQKPNYPDFSAERPVNPKQSSSIADELDFITSVYAGYVMQWAYNNVDLPAGISEVELEDASYLYRQALENLRLTKSAKWEDKERHAQKFYSGLIDAFAHKLHFCDEQERNRITRAGDELGVLISPAIPIIKRYTTISSEQQLLEAMVEAENNPSGMTAKWMLLFNNYLSEAGNGVQEIVTMIPRWDGRDKFYFNSTIAKLKKAVENMVSTGNEMISAKQQSQNRSLHQNKQPRKNNLRKR